jgi:hypothetical protein
MEHAEAVKLIKDYGFAVLKHQNNWLGEAYEALLRALIATPAPLATPSDKQEAVAWIERCVLDEMRETNGGVSTVVYPKQGDPNYDEVPLYAAPLAQSAEQDRIDAEPHVRYCPSCGSIGPVEAKYRDCCPDGSDARMVPEKFAQKCRDTFHLAIDSIKGASK